MISSRWPSGSRKYTPRPPSLWLITPGRLRHRIGPVVELACDDPLEDLVELRFADEERVVLRGDVTVDLVIVE